MENSNMLSMVKKAIPLLSVAGLDIDKLLQDSLKFLPKFFIEKLDQFQAQDPDLKVVLMITTRNNEFTNEDEVWLIPVGVDGIEIKKQYEPLNLNDFISQINITEMINESDNIDPEIESN
jgi:hypothetical protein